MSKRFHRPLACDVCTKLIGPPFDEKHHWGWFQWFVNVTSDGRNGAVYKARVICTKCGLDDWDRPGLLDWPLEWGAGERAVSQCWRMMRDYKWERSWAEYLCNVMHALQYLPTWRGDVPNI